MATVTERIGVNGKTYQVRCYINGKIKVFTFKDRKEAKDKAKEIEAKKTLGLTSDMSNITFSEYAEMVFKNHDKKAEFQTKQNRRIYLKQVNELIGKKKIKDIKPIFLDTYFNDLSENKSDQVLIKHKAIINIVLKSAYDNDIISSNPMDKVKYEFNADNIHEVKPIDINVFNDYINYAKTFKKYYYGLLIMLYTGMRIGELLAIKETDFDFESGTFEINKSQRLNMDIGKAKAGSNRKGIIHESLSEIIYETIQANKENKRIFGKDYRDNGLLICNEDGTPITYNAFRMFLRRLDEKTGIRLRPHQLRHTFSTFLRGMEIKDLQQLTGHKHVETLVNTYQDFDGFKDRTREELDEKFKSIQNLYKN